MGIIARLYADGQVYNVLQTEHSITQRSDETGRPTTRPFHTGLIAVIESTKDTYFFEKAIHPTQQIQEIILEYADSMSGSRTRKIRFVDCYVTLDHTEFKADSREPLTETLLITAAGIEDSHSQGKYTTPRRVTAFLNNQVPLTTQEETEAKIVNQYITDHEDNELFEYERGQEIYCVLESENMNNETVDIDLSKFEVSLLYRGERLQDNIIKDYTISTGEEKIPLQVIPEDHEGGQ